MDFETYAIESYRLKDHPGNSRPHTVEQREDLYRLLGKFLTKLAQMRSGLMCREDAEEAQAFWNNFKASTDDLKHEWAVMSGNAKITVAMRQILAVYRITFPPDHPAIQAAWDRITEIQDLIVNCRPGQFKTRAELTA